MSKGNKTGGRDFVQGNRAAVGNGRPSTPPEIRELRKFTRADFEEILHKMLQLPLSEIAVIMKDPGTSSLEVLVAKVLSEGIRTGDYLRTNFLLENSVGKLPSKLNVTTDSVFERIYGMSNEEREIYRQRLKTRKQGS